jgi:hypothetical protein
VLHRLVHQLQEAAPREQNWLLHEHHGAQPGAGSVSAFSSNGAPVHLMDAASAAAAASNAAAVAAAAARGPSEEAQVVHRRQCWPSRLVQTLDEEDNVLKTYVSQKQAARSIGTSQSGVSVGVELFSTRNFRNCLHL